MAWYHLSFLRGFGLRRIAAAIELRSSLSWRLNHSKIFNRFKFGEVERQFGIDGQLSAELIVLDKSPEFFQAVELSGLIVADGFLLKDVVELVAEVLLQAVGEVTEEALDAVPVAGGRILQGQPSEFVKHFPVEVGR